MKQTRTTAAAAGAIVTLSVLLPLSRAAARDIPIQDNSILIEEGYNQEEGVVQHIFTFQQDCGSHDWLATYTEEWPLFSQKHQIGFTLTGVHVNGVPDRDGFGDLSVNYRFQVLGDGEAPVALAPRISLILPTGNPDRGLGNGVPGYQFNVPLSVVLSDRFVTHWNFGATYTPRARDAAGDRDNISLYAFGAGLIWLAHSKLNVLLESLWTTEETVIGPDRKKSISTFSISPGVRGAINFHNGLQIVPGLAVPVTVGPNAGEVSVLAYLSFEHPLAVLQSRPETADSVNAGNTGTGTAVP